jgi:hypothetical protein
MLPKLVSDLPVKSARLNSFKRHCPVSPHVAPFSGALLWASSPFAKADWSDH